MNFYLATLFKNKLLESRMKFYKVYKKEAS